jgi:TPR repeat protein
MTTVPGTYFNKEQLEADLKGNDYFYFLHSHSKIMNLFIKLIMYRVKAALVVTNYNNIGVLYFDGKGVPKNYLCALKWLL